MTRAETRRISPWWLCAPIVVWVAHFLAVYIIAAIRCAQSSALFEPLGGVRWSILAATLLAAASFAALARYGHRACEGHYLRRAQRADTDQDRFLGSMLVLLCGLSGLAMLAVAAVGLVFGDCRQ